MVRRWTLRRVRVHNVPTIVPLDLAAGRIDRATPAPASAFMTSEADSKRSPRPILRTA